MRARFLTATSAAALCLVLPACGSNTTDSGAPSAPTTATTTVTTAVTDAPAAGARLDAPAFRAAASRPGVTVLDVRTPAEYAEAHIDGAKLIDVSDPAFSATVSKLAKDGDYAVYCRSGNRSHVAMEQMQRAGITRLYDLVGGIGAWQAAGYPVVSGPTSS